MLISCHVCPWALLAMMPKHSQIGNWHHCIWKGNILSEGATEICGMKSCCRHGPIAMAASMTWLCRPVTMLAMVTLSMTTTWHWRMSSAVLSHFEMLHVESSWMLSGTPCTCYAVSSHWATGSLQCHLGLWPGQPSCWLLLLLGGTTVRKFCHFPWEHRGQ